MKDAREHRTVLTSPVEWPAEDRCWLLSFELAVIASRLECVGMQIRPNPEVSPRPLTASALRTLAFSHYLEHAQQEAADGALRLALGFEAFGEDKPWLEEIVTELNARHERGGRKPKYGPEVLLKVATIYASAHENGSSSPTRHVAEALGVTRNVAAKLVSRCREDDLNLLGPTERRRAGGTLLPGTASRKETP